jgi:hypothetical protein
MPENNLACILAGQSKDGLFYTPFRPPMPPYKCARYLFETAHLALFRNRRNGP